MFIDLNFKKYMFKHNRFGFFYHRHVMRETLCDSDGMAKYATFSWKNSRL